ncbi:MAG TPA: leucine-rich repeat domain-containing protein, partial [Acetobacteraceae bacterium]|nr:leucine-rich repeat domain-containing protein [Acetobacteraceae bacterium]
MEAIGTAGLRLPQLPKLDQRDIETVRSFLPGKLLSRTAALLSLVLLVLGFAGAVDWMLEQRLEIHLREMPWLRATLLGGLPLLAVAAQVVVEWRAERQRRQLQALAIKPSKVLQGYFRIGPYLESDRAEFDRADRAQLKVLDWVRQTSSPPLYLTGDSGSGKSSLLNAFILPNLRDLGWTVVEARAWQDPEAALRDALLALPGMRRPRAGETPAIRDLIAAAARRTPAGLLLLVDQFEEFVILGTAEARARFVALLETLRASPVSGMRLLLALRSDYEAQIEECGLPLLRQSENHFPLGRFTVGAANLFMSGSSLGLSDVQLERLLTSAAVLDETPGLIRPITLNVLGTVLSAGQQTAPGLDAGRLIRYYIAQTMAQPALRDYSPAVLEELITGYGTKRPMSEADLVKVTKLRRGEVRAVMNGLAAAGLARPLDGDQAIWELSHDFVARAVARQLGGRRRNVRRHGVAYAAPVLLALTVVSGGLAAAWHWFSPYQLRSELAELGLTVTIESGHSDVEKNSHFTMERFASSAAVLGRLDAATPIRSVDLATKMSDGPKMVVTNVDPLQDLTALTKLDLSNTQVANLEPLKGLTALTTLHLYNTQVANL